MGLKKYSVDFNHTHGDVSKSSSRNTGHIVFASSASEAKTKVKNEYRNENVRINSVKEKK